jgi:hypothetical protein
VRCCGDCADEQDETEPEQDERNVCPLGADRVADHAQSRADAAPVEHRVERSIDVFVERHVEDLGESEHAEQDSSDGGHDPSRPDRQHQRDSHQDQQFHGDADKGGGADLPGAIGREQVTPHERDRKHGKGQPQSHASARAGAGAVQPEHVVAERLGEEQQRGGDRDHPGEGIEHSG